MKKSITILFTFVFIVIWFVQNVNAQVTVTGSTGADATYETLALAFTAINGTAQTGNNIVITITASVTDNNIATLNAGVWTTLKIYPTTSGLTLSGSVDAHLIGLNGADNVTIDGRVNQSGSTDLTITNTNTGSSASTIRFINSAENNTIKYCTVKGAETNSSGGIIFFSTASSGNGNANNTIDNCNLTNDGGNRPYNVIYSSGSSGYENSGNTISNNNIYDFLNAGAPSYGIVVGSNSTAWNITGNSFYETNGFVSTVADLGQYVIFISSSGNNFTVSGNYIGGSAPECGGIWSKTGAANQFTGIGLSVGTVTASNIQGNTIKNISWENTGVALFKGISISAGNVNIGTTAGNIIGADTGTGSITLTNGANGYSFHGMYIGNATVDIRNNTIGSLIAANSNTETSTNIYGIYKSNTLSDFTCQNNTFGSASTPHSIYASSASTSNEQYVAGVYCSGSATNIISGNIIANLTNGTTRTSGYGSVRGIDVYKGTNTISNNTIRNLTIANNNTGNATYYVSIAGIHLYNTTTSAVQTITGNTIYNLSNTYSSFTGSVIGLFYNSLTTASTVSENYIHSLSVSGAGSTSASIYGIKIDAGAATYSNNIIALGGDTKTTLYGIYEKGAAGNNNNLYFNTVYLGGSLVSGSTNYSYALYSNAYTNTRDFRNNIFCNARSTTNGSNLHYAAYFNYSSGDNLALDYNDYYMSGTGGILGYWNSANKTALPLVTDKDTNSKSKAVTFVSATDLHLSGASISDFDLAGTPATGIATDYDGDTRHANYPYMGADENISSPLPVELTFFTASTNGSAVNLNWSTATEINNYGFSVERSEASLNNPEAGASSYSWETIGFVEGHGNSNSPKEYSFADNNLQPGNIQYRLKQIDNDGQFKYSGVVEVAFNLSPSTFELFQNYPNPFNPSTTIRYTITAPLNLPKGETLVRLKVYDILGNEVATLVNEVKPAGAYEIEFNASSISSGIYFYRLQAGEFISTKKFVLLK